MSGTIDLEDSLRRAEGIYQQVLLCKNLPDSIQEIVHVAPAMDSDVNSTMSAATSMNTVMNGHVTSGPSSPSRDVTNHKNSQVENAVILSNPTESSNTVLTSPDDSSIEEILPEDRLDMIM